MAKVLMVIPTAGGIHEMTSMFAARLLQARSDIVEYVTVKGRPSDYVRNSAMRFFGSNDRFTHLFFVDSDTEPPLDCLDRLLALDAPLASGCYPVLMQSRLKWALANKDADGHYRLISNLESDIEPFEVDAGGAGCIMIRRDVLNEVKWPWFRWYEEPDGKQISDDIFFFRKANDRDLRIRVDPQVICNHYKTVNLTAFMRAKK